MTNEKINLINKVKEKIIVIYRAGFCLKWGKYISRKSVLIVFGLLTVIVLFSTVSHFHTVSKEETQSERLNAVIYAQVKKSSATLDNLQLKLDSLTNTLNNSSTVLDVDAFKQGLEQVSTQIEALQKENTESLKEILGSENAIVNKKLDVLQADITELKDSQHPIHYLPAKELPFSVQSIDLIQQQPVVTIGYANKSQPLDLGYSIAGWELIKANYNQQRAEFKNKNDAHIVINLAMQGVSA